MLEPCLVDSDCLRNEVCFFGNESWSNVSICYCNTFYGFSGPDCSETLTEPNGIFVLVIGILAVILCVVFSFMALSNLRLLYKAAPVGKKQLLLSDPVFLTALYFSLGGLLLISYGAVLICIPLKPFQSTIPTDETTVYIDSVSQAILALGLMLLAFGVLTVSLGFIEMTVHLSTSRRRVVKIVGWVYKGILGVTVIALVISRRIHEALLISFPFTVLLAVAYVAGLTLLTQKIKKLSGSANRNDAPLRALKTVRFTIFALCLGLISEIIIGIVWCVYTFFYSWRFFTPPGTLSVCMTGYVLWLPSILGCFAILKDITIWRRVRYARKSGGNSMQSVRPPKAVTFPSVSSRTWELGTV